jgi:hypothetical protein
MPRWLPIRLRFFPVEPRKDSPFLLITTCILMAGVVMAAFLTEASQLSTVRLMEALRSRVPPQVGGSLAPATRRFSGSDPAGRGRFQREKRIPRHDRS